MLSPSGRKSSGIKQILSDDNKPKLARKKTMAASPSKLKDLGLVPNTEIMVPKRHVTSADILGIKPLQKRAESDPPPDYKEEKKKNKMSVFQAMNILKS